MRGMWSAKNVTGSVRGPMFICRQNEIQRAQLVGQIDLLAIDILLCTTELGGQDFILPDLSKRNNHHLVCVIWHRWNINGLFMWILRAGKMITDVVQPVNTCIYTHFLNNSHVAYMFKDVYKGICHNMEPKYSATSVYSAWKIKIAYLLQFV